jgi:superfamily I DNA and RNA helicase
MQGTWWKNFEQLDADQQQFAILPPNGKYVISGPPGCGKTNLLLLRAKFTVKSQLHNILFITYAKCLADFIRSGIGTYFERDQVVTYWAWAWQHVNNYYPEGLEEFKRLFSLQKDNEKRAGLLELLRRAYDNAPSHTLYDAIFIDEAQDLSKEEIEEIAKLSPRVTIAGDRRQGIYKQDGMSVAGFTPVEIKFHYRIGRRICDVADKLLPPLDDEPTLSDFCRYTSDPYGEADAELFQHASSDQQYEALTERLQRQLRTYRGEMLGVFFPKKDMVGEFRDYIAEHQISPYIAFHDLSDDNHSFSSAKPIHAMTIHGSKGAEFRAVHIMRGESLKWPLHHREIIFTAVTRAKTSLSLHYTGFLPPVIKTAFAAPSIPTPADLFEE